MGHNHTRTDAANATHMRNACAPNTALHGNQAPFLILTCSGTRLAAMPGGRLAGCMAGGRCRGRGEHLPARAPACGVPCAGAGGTRPQPSACFSEASDGPRQGPP
jgi:hypothetical protein